eukprot:m.121235 g.121235  ORF g.121235 m.121235 type:complete len:157 (+) comp21887_c0_seq3:71-541(+)
MAGRQTAAKADGPVDTAADEWPALPSGVAPADGRRVPVATAAAESAAGAGVTGMAWTSTCIRCKQSFTEETNGDTACPATKEQRYHDGALNRYGGGTYETSNGIVCPCGEWSCCGCANDGYHFDAADWDRECCKTRPALPATRHSAKKKTAAAPPS